MIDKFPKTLSKKLISSLNIIPAITEALFLEVPSENIKCITISGNYGDMIVYNFGEYFLVILRSKKDKKKSYDINDYLEEIKNLCSLLSEDALCEKIKNINILKDDKKISAFLFRILRFINLRRYQNMNNDIVMYNLGNDLAKINSFDKLKDFMVEHGVGDMV